MFTSRDRFLRRARGLRRSHIPCINDDIPPVPPLPTGLPASVPLAISMPLPPTAQPADCHLSHQPQQHNHHHHYQQSHSNHSQEFSRHVSTCSHISQASSSWSSASSTASTSSFSSSPSHVSDHEWNPLRMHPPAAPKSFFFDDFGLPQPSTSSMHGFDFGFLPKPRPAGRTIRLVLPSERPYSVDFEDDDEADDDMFDDCEFASRDDDNDSMQFATVLSPPPHHRRLRAPQSEADLRQPSRPETPTAEATTSAPPSPVHLRVQSSETSDVERFLKRGDWKRRGIVFGIQEA